jgi:hypothetical protein
MYRKVTGFVSGHSARKVQGELDYFSKQATIENGLA